MIDLYGLIKILAKDRIWHDEKEHLHVIKRVEEATSFNLPKYIVEELFPFGWKSPIMKYAKEQFCEKIRTDYDTMSLPTQQLQEFSEVQMRSYISNVSDSLQNQFENCIETLYGIQKSDQVFLKIEEEFYKKLKKICIEECVMFGLILIDIIVVVASLLWITIVNKGYLPEMSLIFGLAPTCVLFIVVMIIGLSRKHRFKIHGIKPKLYNL